MVQERGGTGTGAAVWLLGALFALAPAPGVDTDGERGVRSVPGHAPVTAAVLPGPADLQTDPPTDLPTDPVAGVPSATLPPRAPISPVGPTFGVAPPAPIAAGRARWTTSLPPPSVP